MNFKSHLISAAAALVMTGATFASISGYATHVADAGHQQAVQLVAATTAARPADVHEVSYNAVDTELPTVTVVGHHKRAA
ncbi:hypothetical protein [Solimonas soli]|uniref:hypothetical protein n=1 Tax=Solimonas soli TaxID=413479 RepID=UPI000487976F|nr:hypothetical protein [Solimonas soli]